MPDSGSKPAPGWTTSKSVNTYQVRGWGEPYFRVGDSGRVEVRPDPTTEQVIDLYELVRDLEERGLEMPLLLRFSNILEDRIRLINECFGRAMTEYGYEGAYRGVFPVKVNQQRHLIDEVVKYGRAWSFGLEAGSKPELLIALATMERSDGLLVCNGYKDLKYIETALIAQRFDKTVILVLERVEELDLVFRASERLEIRPVLGVRAKLGSKGMGRWADSAGDRAKFGLSSSDIVDVIDRLAARGMLDCLQLLHFHIGSQVSSIIPVKNALREAARFYVELAKMGAGMRYIDVGGGLAIDYDGSKTDFHASKNYTVQEYAYDVVAALQEACQAAGVSTPTIISESGRAIAAHQSVLVFDVLGTNESELPEPEAPCAEAHPIIHELYETWKNVVPKNVQEAWHDASQAKEEAQSLFKFGYLTLRQRAEAERLFIHCGHKIIRQMARLKHIPEELDELERVFSSVYYCNFSLFQSAPDTWAIDQLFPIMPIHRLDEEPTVKARLADLTCDSDGVIDSFIDIEEEKNALEVHALREGERYYLAMFLMGAYQEILGDLHNLFGDTHAVHVRVAPNGYEVSHVIKGDSMHEVLRYVEYDPDGMTERVRRQAEAALQDGRITLQQMRLLMDHYEQSLRSYTYLSDEE
jgi:arginine decarboxylase